MITIGIVSFNRLKYLESLLKSIDDLDRQKFNVVVVDNGSWEIGLVTFLEHYKNLGKINKLFLRPTEERNWINDEYIAKNIIIEACKDEIIVFLQDDLQFIGDEEYLLKLCEDFEGTDFQCLDFNGIRKNSNQNKFIARRSALSKNNFT